MVSGWLLGLLISILLVWLMFLYRELTRFFGRIPPPRTPRFYVTIAALACAITAVLSLLALHLSWISPDVSQRLGANGIRAFGLLLFWPTILGIVVGAFAMGRTRIVSITTCLITGMWWFTLMIDAAISMGAPRVRHPSEFLIPKGYIGWVTIKHGVEGAPADFASGKYVYRIPVSGVLETSSAVEDGWAHDSYFYCAKDGSLEKLSNTGWGEGGLIWAEQTEWEMTPYGSPSKRMNSKFYVGTEEAYHRNESHPINSQQ